MVQRAQLILSLREVAFAKRDGQTAHTDSAALKGGFDQVCYIVSYQYSMLQLSDSI